MSNLFIRSLIWVCMGLYDLALQIKNSCEQLLCRSLIQILKENRDLGLFILEGKKNKGGVGRRLQEV